HQGWHDGISEMFERDLVAEEERLVRGHCLDHVDGQFLVTALELCDEISERREPMLAGDRVQPAFHEILLVRRQLETRTLLQELAEIVVVERAHDLSPRNSRTTFG